MNMDDLGKYEGKRVTLTITLEGVLKRRRGDYRYPFLLEGLGGNVDRLIKPGDVDSVRQATPQWWPPMPGDVLHYRLDNDLLYIVNPDGTRMYSSATGSCWDLSTFRGGHGGVYDPANWELAGKGPARVAKECK